MTTKDDKEKKAIDYVAQQRNWEQRVLSEHESPHKWNETWGALFQSEVPFNYEQRIEYLENKLNKFKSKGIEPPPKV